MLDSDTLIQHYLEESLNETEAGQLHELLIVQPELGEKLLQHLEMDAMLRATKEMAANRMIRPAFAPKRHFTYTRVAAMAACITLLATWLLRPGMKSGEGDITEFVAIYTRGLDPVWETAPITPGVILPPGLQKLKSGIAQIDFFQGARVVIEGPAEFQLISSSEASCTQGKLIAYVPQQAKGFRINTPKGSIVDLGTEFGLKVNAKSSEVHVFNGEVELQKGSESVNLLKEGQGMSFGLSTQLIAANTSSFASLKEFNSHAAFLDRARFEHWLSQSDKMKSDSDLKIYFDFQEDTNARSLRNHAPQGEDGNIVGTGWTEGRWLGKRALEFRNKSDRVRLSIPGETQALTMALSVRVDGLDRPRSALFMSDDWIHRRIHWQILDNGRIRFGAAVFGHNGDHYDSPVYFTPERFGSWVHLAVVFDPAAKELRHYANGTLLSRLPLVDSSPLKIGLAELGNWNIANDHDGTFNIRYLKGAMDEFALWNRALSDDEINKLVK